MIYWVNMFLGGVLYVFFMGMVWSFLLEPRWPKVPRWLLSAGLTVADMIPGIVRSLCGELSPLFHTMGYIQMAIIFLFLFFCFRSQWWKKLLAYSLHIIAAHLAEGIVFPLFELAGIRYNSDFNSYEMLILQTAVCIVSMCFSAVMVFLWNKVEKQRKVPQNAWIYLSVPISQLLMVWNVAESFWGDYTGMLPTVVGCVIGFVADIMLFYFLMEQGEKEVLANQLQELEKLRSAEELHYKTIVNRREELAKIRHDFNNQLTAALHLTENGDTAQAKELLEQLKDSIAQTKETDFCKNAIINAVMTEKAAECQRLGITLDIEMALDSELAVAPIHLCSIFSNLLDNAIRATKGCPLEQRKIIVRGATRGDYLHIKVINFIECSVHVEKKSRKGYGQEILKDIAHQYNGEFQTEQAGNCYTAMMSLEITSPN